MGRRHWRSSFSYSLLLHFRYDASISQRQQVWLYCPFLQSRDEVRIVFLPTFSIAENAPTARGVSWCTRITAVGVR